MFRNLRKGPPEGEKSVSAMGQMFRNLRKGPPPEGKSCFAQPLPRAENTSSDSRDKEGAPLHRRRSATEIRRSSPEAVSKVQCRQSEVGKRCFSSNKEKTAGGQKLFRATASAHGKHFSRHRQTNSSRTERGPFSEIRRLRRSELP